MKLLRTDKQVSALRALANGEWWSALAVARCVGSPKRADSILKVLVRNGLAEHGWPPAPTGAHWRITDAGREFLKLLDATMQTEN